MTTKLEIELQSDLFNFLERYAREQNRRRDEIVAQALKLLYAEWELEKGYFEDNEENLAFAESALPLFAEVTNEPAPAR